MHCGIVGDLRTEYLNFFLKSADFTLYLVNFNFLAEMVFIKIFFNGLNYLGGI